jgi:hypothetical protein
MVGQLFDCLYCLNLWVALPFALRLGATRLQHLLLCPALSAGVIFFERGTDGAFTALTNDNQHKENSMSCCGSKRRQVFASAFAASGTAAAARRSYHIGQRGTSLSVDARDAPMLEMTPKLRRVST